MSFGLSNFLPQSVFAKSYTIPSVEISIQLNHDGSASVTENRTFDFDGNFTFAYQKINRIPDQSANPGRREKYDLSNFQICDQTTCFRRLQNSEIRNADDLRPAQTFYVLENNDNYYIKWFYRSSSQEKFILKYQIDNAITLHQDTAEFYWQLVGDEWELAQDKVTAQVKPPPSTNPDSIQAWAHGPLGEP